MRKLILNLIALSLILALTGSIITALPATGQDTTLIIDKLNELHDKLEGERPVLQNKVNAVIHQIEAGAFNGALNKLEGDVKKSVISWVENPEELIELINEIIDLIKGVVPPPPPDFEITIPPYRLDVMQGGFNTTIVTITSVGNFSAEVNLCATTTATGVTVTLGPDSVIPPINGSINAVLWVEALQEAPLGDYEITVTGTSGLLEHSVTIPLKIVETTPPPIQDFSIEASPTALTIQQGLSNTSVISVTSINSFNKPVELAVTSAPILGVNTTLNASVITPPPDSYALSILMVEVASSTTPGTFIITVAGESNSLEHSINITLEVIRPPIPPAPDFSINSFPTSLTIEQGETATATITVTSLDGFEGTVSLTVTPSSISGATLTLDPLQITLTPSSYATSTLEIEIDLQAEPSDYEITIIAASGTLEHSAIVSLEIELEKKPPRIASVSLLSGRAPAYNETATVIASVFDLESGLKDVMLSFSVGGIEQNLTMIPHLAMYEATIPAFSFKTSVDYRIYASDEAGNWAISTLYSYTVTDPYPPLISLPSWQPQEPTADEPVTVNVTVNEYIGASGVKTVTLWYRNTTTNAWKNTPMTPIAGSASWTATISNQSATTVEFYVEAIDQADNRIQSATQEFTPTIPAFPLSWILAAVALLAAATGGGAYYVRRKRRRGVAETSVPSAAIQPVPPTS